MDMFDQATTSLPSQRLGQRFVSAAAALPACEAVWRRGGCVESARLTGGGRFCQRLRD